MVKKRNRKKALVLILVKASLACINRLKSYKKILFLSNLGISLKAIDILNTGGKFY